MRPRPALITSFFAIALFHAAAGCASIPEGRYGVSRLRIEGTDSMDDRALEACLATHERPSFRLDLGVEPSPECGIPPFDSNRVSLRFWRWPWTDWPLFDRSVFERDTERIERWYRARGFYEARVLSSSVEPPEARMSQYQLDREEREACTEDCEVEIAFQVTEGEPILVHDVVLAGIGSLAQDVRDAVRDALVLEPGDIFDEALYERTKEAIQIALANGSYAHARVDGRVTIDPPAHRADIRIVVDAGPECVFGEITVVDNEELPAGTIAAAALISPGDPFSQTAVLDAQHAIASLGAFSSVVVTPQIPEDRTVTVIPVLVSAAPGRLFRYGVGLGIQAGIQTYLGETESVALWDVHLLALVEFRNFIGGLRRLRIEERPRLIFLDGFPGLAPDKGGPQPGNVLRLEFRQPSFLEPRTTLVLGATWDLGPDPYQGFFRHDIDAFIGPERSFFDGRLLLALRFRYNVLFPIGNLPDGTPPPSQYHLPFFELFGRLDLRDEPKRPTYGLYFQMGAHEGGYGIPASWRYIRLTPELRGYVPLPLGLVLAARFALGITFIEDPDPELDATSQRLGPQRFRLRGGGATSNRGYLPGLVGDGLDGGLRRWEASLELRIPVTENFALVVFGDAGDVHAGRGPDDPRGPEEPRFRFDWAHISVGFGLRYYTIIGPLRLDVGFQIPEAQVLGQPDAVSGRAIDNPTSRVDFGFATFAGALHLTIGEAF